MASPSERRLPRSVLVAGGRGFVGSHIVRRLLEAGVRVHLFGPPMADDLLADRRGDFAETDGTVEDRGAVLGALRESRAEAVVTAAAFSAGRQGLMRSGEADSDRALAVNVLGLRNVFEAAREAGLSRVVWTGSTVVYGPAESYPSGRVDEDAPSRPLTFYGLTKVLGEDVARYYRDRHGMRIVGLRLPLVLGEGLWYSGAASAIAGLVSAARPGARHEVAFHDDPMDLMHVADAADAVLAALDMARDLAAVYNINGFTARLSDIAACVQERVPGYAVEHRHQPPQLSFPLVADGRFRRDTGFSPRRGLEQTVDAMLSQKEPSCTSNA